MALVPASSHPSGGGSQTDILLSVTEISSAQILALHNAPVQLVAAPGAGNAVFVAGDPLIWWHFGTTPYDGHSSDPSISTPPLAALDANLGYYFEFIAMAQTADRLEMAVRSVLTVGVVNVSPADYINQPVVLHMEGENPTGGDGTATLYLPYRILDLS